MQYMLTTSRELLIKDAGWSHQAGQVSALAVFGGAIFTLAAVRFQ
jgi:hypothetical protein